ncbi:peptidylprolyl isomerase [Candidatus Dependentiae bacterium]|nr:peptidylprolyl isomerase [Candidatus Dependentiae bacterium]
MKKIFVYFSIISFISIIIFSSCSKNPVPPSIDSKNNELVFDDNPILISSGNYSITRKEFLDRMIAITNTEAILQNKDLIKDNLKLFLQEKILYDKAIDLDYNKDVDYLIEKEKLEKEMEIKTREALIRTMIIKEVDNKYKFDEKKLENFYKLNKVKFEKRSFSEILRVVNDVNDQQEVKKVEKEIKMIAEKLKRGEKFETLAKEYYNGVDYIRKNSGALGLIIRGKFPQEFENIGYDKLRKVGDISEPFLYNQGWAIIRLDNIWGFKEQKEFIKREFERDLRGKINRKIISEYMKEYKKIEYKDLEIEKIINP